MSGLIQELIIRNRGGEPVGLPCFCTSNEHVLRAILAFSGQHDVPVPRLIAARPQTRIVS